MIPQYQPEYKKEEEGQALYDLVASGSFLADFKKTAEFETAIATLTDNYHCVAVNNGTIALSLSLHALGVRPGDKVLVPDMTMIATATAVQFIGAIPIFCDVEEDGCMSISKAIEICLSQKIKAVIYVTFNGRVASNFVDFRLFCPANGILLVKDDAQSLGSFDKENVSLQSPKYGYIHTLSFSPHKIVSCGQGGAILTSDEELYKDLKRIKDFGRLNGGADFHEYFGINSKFTEMQATVGLIQLSRLEQRKATKIRIYQRYFSNLKDRSGLKMIPLAFGSVPWMVDLYFETEEQRDAMQSNLTALDVQTRKMYPRLSSQPIYQKFNSQSPQAEYNATRGLWLPSSFNLTDNEIDFICDIIKGS